MYFRTSNVVIVLDTGDFTKSRIMSKSRMINM